MNNKTAKSWILSCRKLWLSSKAQMGMHMFGFADIFIVLFGVILGVALVWYGLKQGWLPASAFCPAALVRP